VNDDNDWSYTSTPPYIYMMCVISTRDNFAITCYKKNETQTSEMHIPINDSMIIIAV
jgi:hypothetical protein